MEDLKINETAAKVVADYQEQHDKALSDILLHFLTSQGLEARQDIKYIDKVLKDYKKRNLAILIEERPVAYSKQSSLIRFKLKIGLIPYPADKIKEPPRIFYYFNKDADGGVQVTEDANKNDNS